MKTSLALELAFLSLAAAATSCAATGGAHPRGGGVYLVGVAGGG